MERLQIPYPDFKMGEIIDPEQHDLNNRYIQNKINELISNIGEVFGEEGAKNVKLSPIIPFNATNVYDTLKQLIERLQDFRVGISGGSLVNVPSLSKIVGSNVEEQLRYIDYLLGTAHVITSNIADRAVTSTKIANQAVKAQHLDPAILTNIGESALANRLVAVEENLGDLETNFTNLSNKSFIGKTNTFLSGEFDFNDLEPNKSYKIGDVTVSLNAPPVSWGILNCYQPENGYMAQEFISVLNSTKYLRTTDGSKWSPWIQIGYSQDKYSQWDTGYNTYLRFQGNCQIITNWNDAIQNGMYMALDALNAPSPTGWYMGTVIAHNAEYVTQHVYSFGGGMEGQEYKRHKAAGVWGTWVETSPQKLFQSVSEGKNLLANALTDMGKFTLPTDTFATMSTNIRGLSSAKKGSGINTNPSDGGGRAFMTITGLGFRPKAVFIRVKGISPNNLQVIGNLSWAETWAQDPTCFLYTIGSSLSWGNYTPIIASLNDDGFSFSIAYEGLRGFFDWIALKDV